MPVAKVVTAQRDFTGGEADPALKRADDHPLLKTSARQMRNWRMLNTRGLANRPGRRALMIEGVRVDQVVMSPTNTFYLVFGSTYLRVYNAAFTKVFDSGNVMPWTTTTAKNVVWDSYKLSIYMCFDGMQPRILSWDGVSQSSAWTLSVYAERFSGGQKRTVFYRLSPLGITMQPGGLTGQVNLTFSGNVLDAGMINTRMRYIARQILINGVTNATAGTAVVQEPELNHSGVLPGAIGGTALNTVFYPADEIIGATSDAKAYVVSVTAANVTVQKIVGTSFQMPETVGGPHGNAPLTAGTVDPPLAVPIWDDEVMNTFRGWPRSCFVDQGRLGFCDFPALPGLIAWSAVGDFTDLYTDPDNAAPTNAIQELVPGKSRVLYVVPGPDGTEFVFCDNAVYSIPINQSNPLRPGSVAFNTLIAEGCAPVQPRPLQQSIIYVSAGFQQMKAVQAIGAYNRPYIVDDITENHAHLLATPVAIAAPGGSDQFEESYFYVSNADGSIVLCKFSVAQGIIDTKTLGFVPWSGGGTATWISALIGQSDVLVTGTYAPNGVAAASVVERVDATQYLDAAILYNAAPPTLGGPSPLWWIAGGTVDLMDGGRMMGTYAIDANGFLIPQGNAGENLASTTLIAGQAWTATLEPWVPAVQPGQDVQQRMRKRRVMRFEAYVTQSTGFTMDRLFSGPVTRTSPAIGTIMSRRRIETWNQDDDPTVTPPLREQAYSIRPIGRFHDPRVAIIKDTPGPLTILEIDLEVTV